MYELLYIVPAPLTEKNLPDVSKKVKKLIESFGGKIVKEENLGNKKLSYSIKKAYRGFYLLINFEMEAKKLKEFNQNLKLMPEILRHLIIKAIEKRPARIAKKPLLDEMKKENIGKDGKVDLKELGEKIDDLFKI